jgi:signal transduction histidine kinase/CheY-like chemotaxis protein
VFVTFAGAPVLKIFTCLTVDHDWRLVLVAALVCVIATATAFRLYALAARSEGSLKLAWIAFGGLAAGCGIWATHFIAMLAYVPRLTTGYAPGGTLLSLVLAVVTTGVGFGVASRKARLGNLVLGGALLGVGVSAMHYVGMAAYRIQGVLHWDLGYLIASVSVGILVAVAAVTAAGHATRLRDQAIGAGLFTLAICSMHFTGMSAVTIVPDLSVVVPDQVLNRGVMAAAVTALAVLIALAAIGTVAIEAVLRRSSHARLRAALDVIPQALAIFDAEDRYVIWNSRYAELNAGFADALAVGTPFRNAVELGLSRGRYPQAVGREAEWLEERMARRSAMPATYEMEVEEGRWLRVEERRTPDGGVVAVWVDVTEMKRDALALAKARDEAQAANRAKSEFLANMSHEIRTPLNGVMGVADVLAGTTLDSAQRELVEMVRTSAGTLERLLSDVLDLARIESGRLEMRPEPFELGAAAREIIALYEPRAAEKDVGLVLDLAPGADRWVTGDAMRLKQILGNLVSNAIKFTAQGEVRLSILSEGDTGQRWRCEVTDTGIGFSHDERDRIFGRFEQADGSVTRRFGGSGLGLAICSQLAELLDAALDCESTPGAGSTFVLSLDLPPYESAATHDAETPAEAQAAAEMPALRVLLADDHPTNRKVVELILAQAGVELMAVENGELALEAFRQGGFDAVLMDMQMPVMDGLTATRAIRAFERAAGQAPTPVIMLTANALPEHIEASRAAGAERHLTKPIGASTLLGALIEIADAAESRKAA